MSVRWSDGGPFGVIPAWVLEADVSDRAVRAYAMLARHAGAEGSTFRGKKELAERLRCGRTAADTAVAELVAIGALSIEERFAKNGARIENGYVVHAAPPPRPDGGATPPGRGATRARSLPGEPSTDLEPSTESPAAREVAVIVTRRGWSVDRKPVTDVEDDLARGVLTAYNTATGQARSSKDAMAMIVMRIREHPELSLDEHAFVIETAIANPWWKDATNPNVIYGNGNIFESSLEAAKAVARGQPSGGKEPKEPLRYGRGMTTKQMLEATRGRSS